MADLMESRSHTEVDLESLENKEAQRDNDEPEKSNVTSTATAAPAARAAPEQPEGGTKAWLSVLGASAALFTSFGWTNCIGLFQDEYQTHQLKQYSSSTVSWITSVQFFFMLGMAPVAGKIFDSYGPRVPVLIGSILHVFGIMMTSLCKEYYQFFLSQSVVSGIGASFIFTPALSAPQTYFRKRRGVAAGLTVAGSSLGGVIFPLMVQHLLPEVGFGWTMRICGFLILGMLVIANLFISSALAHKHRPFHIMQYIAPLRELNFAILCVSEFFMFLAMLIPFDYIVTAAITYRMSSYMAWGLVPILNGASLLGRTLPNYIADKYGRFNVMTMMSLMSTVLTLALWLPGHNNAAMICFAAFFGFSSGGVIGLGPSLIGTISPMNELGFRMGVFMAFTSIGALVGPPVAGAIISADNGSYVFVALFAGLCFAIATIGMAFVRVRLAGPGLTAKI
ncbi:monocarboxylate permease, putative [Talaromyces stipitatus ATCC 10500]|uniref:Monocarboxylate permease, putative n=1 Tax=Talaromyces stipitatus (strain ATCC 10500 / CBS 375.48 / QM 6759 / NRRL 1006) TaxID=441959 RepID=B8MGS6_TALSN|nr:monocarboxylate permease, putative [Talaromyces stipitatus ATCC 10500]EED16307.1 monocarboxylate permease, putative [Talaromyces stipitatus ATCC 10500]